MASCSTAPTSAASSSTLSTGSSSLRLTTQPSAGLLNVEILGARNLPPAVLGSLLKWTPSYANPYVVLSLDRERFVSSVKQRDLNPSWKETGALKVPLPSETEVLQTVGMPGGRSVGAGGKGSSKGKGKGGSSTLKKTGAAAAAADAAMGYRQYHPCAPELYVQVFHHAEEKEVAAAPNSNSSTLSNVSALGPDDKLVGAVVVPLLPCLMSTASSSRGWYQLTDEESQSAGQLQLAINFDVSAASNGLEPRKGDIVRLTGFGGLEYYSKILPPSTRLEVIDIFQDQVLAQTRSQEGWSLSFELHRNLVHVERRPSLLLNASEQLQTQVTRVRQFRVVTGAQRVWRALPDTPRVQFENSAAFVAFFGAQAYSTLVHSVNDLLRAGVHSGVQTFVASSKDAFGQVKHEFVRVYWSTPRRVTNGNFDGGYDDDLIDCGPKTNRGHIVRAFTAADRLALDYVDHEEEMMMHWETYEDEDGYDPNEGADEGAPEVPEQLICPITGCPMLDPVVAADGHSYEREAILQWFTTSNISPMTGMHMPTTQVFPNFTLRQLSEEVQAAAARRQQANRRRHRRHSAAAAAQAAEQPSQVEEYLEGKAASSEESQE